MSAEMPSVSSDTDLAVTIRAAATEAKARQRHLREALDVLAAEHGDLTDTDIDRLIGEARSLTTVVSRGAG